MMEIPPGNFIGERSDEERAAKREEYKRVLLAKLEYFRIELDPDRKDQHLIVNPEVIDDLVDFAEITRDDSVLEIGSGPGNITEKLGEVAGRVYALEIDPRFKQILEDLRSKNPNIEIIIGDYFNIELPEFNKIVANPPFSVLEPMLQKFSKEGIESVTLVIGEKYYRRATARIGTDNFTKTSLFTQADFEVEFMRRLGKEDFYPKSREIAVITKLVRKGRTIDVLLQQIAGAFSEDAGMSVKRLVNNICAEYSTPKGKITPDNYDQFITVDSLNLPREIMNKRLQALSNREISRLVACLVGVKEQGRRR